MIPNPILHLDGDAFFVACEVAKNPRLRGKAVVVGEDKGIATALSYEAKALGIGRGTPIFHIKKFFPKVIILPSDFVAYQCFSERAMNIVRRHVARVEEYSVDECFADLSTSHSGETDYVTLGRRIKDDIQRLLGLTYSAGIAQTKVLAKIASKRKKPNGFTALEPNNVSEWINDIPIGAVWGIGMSTVIAMRTYGIDTAGKLAALPQERVEELFNRPQVEIWHELNGRQINKVTIPGEKEHSKSIQDTRSFQPATADRVFLLAELSKHTEGACSNLREEGLLASSFSFFLKSKQGEYSRTECTLHRPTSSPSEILSQIRQLFDRVYRPSLTYKSTGVTLFNLRSEMYVENDLFGESHGTAQQNIFTSIDSINHRHGEGSVKLASSLGGRKHSVRPSVIGLPLQYLGEVG